MLQKKDSSIAALSEMLIEVKKTILSFEK